MEKATQTPEHPWALRAMDQRQEDLAEKFRKQLGIFYSRQEGSFASLSEEERKGLGIEDWRDIRMRPLAQTFLAVQGDIYNMAHVTEVFACQKLYDGTFRSTYLHSNVRAIVLAYKVGLLMVGVMSNLRKALAERYQTAIPKARNLTWALLVQALLNDKKLPPYLDSYGSDLVKQADFRDVLKRLTGNRIAPLLRDLLGSSVYQDKGAKEKYNFLRTSEAFQQAMAIAGDRYGWSKKSLGEPG